MPLIGGDGRFAMVKKSLTPRDAGAAATFGRALASHQDGRLDDAEALYREALAADPFHAEALHMLGVLAHGRGELATAIALVERAVAINPRLPAAQHNLAKMLAQAGRPDAAIAHYRAAVALDPDHHAARFGLATALQRQGRLDEAVQAHQALLATAPNHRDGLVNLGAALEELGRLDEAATVLRRALAAAPDDVAALNNLGNVLQRQGAAEAATDCFHRALAAAPDNPDIEANLGNALQKQGLIDEARACYGRALARRPAPGLALRAALTLPVIYRSAAQMADERRGLDAALDELLDAPIAIDDPFREVGVTGFYLAYQGLDDRPVQEKLARVLLRACPSLAWTAPHCRDDATRRRGRRIRLGVASHHLRNHTIGKLNRGLIARLDRTRFEVIVFSTSREADEIAHEIRAHADRFVALPQRLEAARALIAEAALDVLYYPDVGMDPLTYFLAFARLAPVQCTTWGHPVTTGIPNMDGFISSTPAEAPGAEQHYSERLVRLSVMSNYYHWPALPARPKSRADLGLDGARHLYVCPQTLFKLHPAFDEMLGEILRRDSEGEVLLIEGAPASWTELVRRRLRTNLGAVADRIRFLPRMPGPDFMSLIAAADVMLDTTHFCGGNTSYEAFALGTPVVTLPSPLLRARLTAGMYRQMEIAEPVAERPEQYVDTAVRLGTDADVRAALAARIAERRAVLFENDRAVREHEMFFGTACP
jgi:predicted O-linked N-acetylglucosamine transferase (SPINDLY family)